MFVASNWGAWRGAETQSWVRYACKRADFPLWIASSHDACASWLTGKLRKFAKLWLKGSVQLLFSQLTTSHFRQSACIFLFTITESATGLGRSIRVPKWDMTDKNSSVCNNTASPCKNGLIYHFFAHTHTKYSSRQSCANLVLSIWIELCSNQTNHGLFQTWLLQTVPWVMNWKKSVFDYPRAGQGWPRSIWEVVQWNSNMDALQLLTLSLSGRCAFSVLTLVVPHLLPPGSFAILLMADTGSLFPTLHYWCIRGCG